MSAQAINKRVKEVFVYVVVLFILLLAAINVDAILKPHTKVLGIETQNTIEINFWENFMKDHPNYIPGWIELGRIDRVKEIDPNYF